MKLIINNDQTVQIQNNTSDQTLQVLSYSIYTNQNNTEPENSNIPQPPIIIDGGATTNILTDYQGDNMTFNAADEVFNVNYLPPPDVSGNYTTINRAITGLSTSTTSTTTPGGYPYKIENLDIEMLVPTTTPYSLTSSTPVLFTTTSAPVSLGLVVSFPPDTVVSPDDFRTAVTAAAEANSAINTAIIDNAVITTIDANDILMKLSTNINVDTWIDFVKLLRPSDFTELGTTQYIALYQNGSQSIYCNVTNSGCSNGIPGQEIDCIYPNYYCNSYEDIKTKQCNSI